MRLRTSDWLVFIREYMQSPASIASVFPSSRYLARSLSEHSGLDRAKTIVEIGSGTGVVTEYINEVRPDSSSFFSIELNESLAKVAKNRCAEVDIINADARDLKAILGDRGLSHCDSIVSCIPWATLSSEAQSIMIDVIYESLEDGGRFATLLLLPGLKLSSTKRFCSKVSEKFGSTGFGEIVWANLPPAIVFWSEK